MYPSGASTGPVLSSFIGGTATSASYFRVICVGFFISSSVTTVYEYFLPSTVKSPLVLPSSLISNDVNLLNSTLSTSLLSSSLTFTVSSLVGSMNFLSTKSSLASSYLIFVVTSTVFVDGKFSFSFLP